MKRLFDICVALLGVILLTPVFVLTAVAVALSGRGPVLFRQTRIGQFGKEFQILKFRTMRVSDHSDGALLTVGMDPRVTTVGHILRASKLDELPQLWNVVRGDMSIVGPRPEVQKYIAMYPPELAERVLSVRPGITDEASILYCDESEILAASSDPERTYIEEILPHKLELHAAYADRHSVLSDLGIIARTAYRVLLRRGRRRDRPDSRVSEAQSRPPRET